uniref:(northern house mosquito) hypothetical protein n=1 Tax=Culex pipiens TaxID=7175 RepID=A0A8D8ERG6_CULPI
MWGFAVFVRTVEFGGTQFWMAVAAERIGWICNRLCTTIRNTVRRIPPNQAARQMRRPAGLLLGARCLLRGCPSPGRRSQSRVALAAGPLSGTAVRLRRHYSVVTRICTLPRHQRPKR